MRHAVFCAAVVDLLLLLPAARLATLALSSVELKRVRERQGPRCATENWRAGIDFAKEVSTLGRAG
jgi:hypothetical protein